MVIRVGGGAGVAELRDDFASRGVHSFGDLGPAGGLGVGVDAWDVDEADRVRADPGPFADDQAGAGALRVVGGVQGGGGQFLVVGPGARHGSHDDAVGQLERAQLNWLQEGLGAGY